MILYRLISRESIFVRGGKPFEFPCWLWETQGYFGEVTGNEKG